MSYLGNAPESVFTEMKYQDLTGGSGTSFTLNQAVSNPQEIEVFVNNVRQEPSAAYSVSGTTLTMTESVGASEDFYVIFQGMAQGSATHPATQSLEAASVTSTGAISGTTGTFSGAISGTSITGTSFVSSGNMTFADNDKIILGTGSDLQIFHDPGGNSFINESGSGSLVIKATNTFINASDDAAMAAFYDTAQVELYHNASKKFATTSTGIDVTGIAVTDGLTSSAALDVTTSTHANASVFKSTGNTQIMLQDTDASANDQFWGLQVSGGAFNILTCNDDRASGFSTPLYITQAGTVVSSSGVAIGGTGAANTLDDYEEGTFTPALNLAGGGLTVSYTGRSGFYTKIGNRVFCEMNINLSSHNGGTGVNVGYRIEGFPFATASNAVGSYTAIYENNNADPVGFGRIENNSTNAVIFYTGPDHGLASNANLYISVSYRA